MGKQSVSALIITRESASRLADVLASIRPCVDEIVVAVDPRSTDGTADVARAHADRVEPVRDHDFLHLYHPMFEQCRGQWILRLDDDEVLSANWTRERMQGLVESSEVTNYFIPRKWLVPPGDRYVCDVPLYPNFAMRLFRNDRRLLGDYSSVHSQIPITGPSAFLGDLHLVHWNFLIYSRADREKKIEFYRARSASAAGAAGEEYYLYEDYSYDAAPIEANSNQAWPEDPNLDWPFCIDARVTEAPLVTRPGRPYFFMVDVRNRSNRTLGVQPHEFPHSNPQFCYGMHWFGADAATGSSSRAGAPITPMWLPIIPGSSRQVLVETVAPATPGRYWVRPDVFAKGTGWFSQIAGAGYHAYRSVSVQPVPIRGDELATAGAS